MKEKVIVVNDCVTTKEIVEALISKKIYPQSVTSKSKNLNEVSFSFKELRKMTFVSSLLREYYLYDFSEVKKGYILRCHSKRSKKWITGMFVSLKENGTITLYHPQSGEFISNKIDHLDSIQIIDTGEIN